MHYFNRLYRTFVRNAAARPAVPISCAVLAVCAVTFFLRLGAPGFLGPDEPRYAQVAYEMAVRRDWISPTLLGRPWFEKPVLSYWLMQSSYGVFGATEWAARLPSAILATGVVWTLWAGFRRTGGDGLAAAAAAALAVNPLFIGFARAATFEAPIAAAVFASLACFHRMNESASEREFRRARTGFHIFLGVGLLAKGLVGIAVPGLVVALFLATDGTPCRDKVAAVLRMRPVSGALIAAATAGTWYLPVCWRHGRAFIDEFFIAHHFQRFTSNRFHHPGPIHYYIPVLLLGLLPWTPFAIAGAWRALRPGGVSESPARRRLVRLALCWAVTPVALFSLSGSKLPGYILPAWPACAILAAYGMCAPGRMTDALARASAALMAGLAAATLFAAERILHTDAPALNVGVAILAILGAAAAAAPLPSRTRIVAALSGTALLAGLVSVTLPASIEARESLKSLSLTAVAVAERPDETLTFFRIRKYAPAFYASSQLACCDADGEPNRPDSVPALAAAFGDAPSLLVLTAERHLPEMEASPLLACERLRIANGFALVRVRPAPPLDQVR
jgi:4-amino-4-deoxy-L-arabinose transferase-like glycosyltransferase